VPTVTTKHNEIDVTNWDELMVLKTQTDFAENYFYVRPTLSFKGAKDLGDINTYTSHNTFFSLPLWSVHAYGLNEGTFKDNAYFHLYIKVKDP